MRSAEEIVREYLQRGYSAERIRAIAATKPEAVRLKMLAALENPELQAQAPVPAPEAPPALTPPSTKIETDSSLGAEMEQAPPEPPRPRARRTVLRRTQGRTEPRRAAVARGHHAGEPTHGIAETESDAPATPLPEEVASAPKEAGASAPAVEPVAQFVSPATRDEVSGQQDSPPAVASAPQAQPAETGTEEVSSLRDRLHENEQRLAMLEEQLTAREDDLRALRSRFEQEATELRRRAEQEVRLMRRHMILYRRLAAAAGAAAGLMLCIVVIMAVVGPRRAPRPGPEYAESGPLREGTQRTPLGEAATRAEPAVELGPRIGTAAKAPTPEEGTTPAPPVAPPTPVHAYVAPPAKAPAPVAKSPEAERTATSKIEPPTTSDYVVYTVLAGDSLWTICKLQLNDVRPETIRKVAELNRLSDPSALKPGQTLKLPRSAQRE